MMSLWALLCKIHSWEPPCIPPIRGIFSFILKITHCANNLKIAHCAQFCFAARNRLKNVVFTLWHLANQKGRCKKPVLRRAANSLWKPVNIILKLYGEDAYIFYCFRLANPNRFLEFALLHKDALTPSRMFYLQDLSGSYDVTSAINCGSARPLCCISDQSSQYPHRTHTCYCEVIISSPSTISLKCCEKALKDNRHIASVAKPLFIAGGSPQVSGPRPRPACFNVFHTSDRTQYRCRAHAFSWE